MSGYPNSTIKPTHTETKLMVPTFISLPSCALPQTHYITQHILLTRSSTDCARPHQMSSEQTMTPSSSIAISELQVESVKFPPSVKPPGSAKSLFLGGAGVRGVEIQGKFIKVSAIAVYLEDAALPSLAPKWGTKSAEELVDCLEFFTDIIAGPFEKFSHVTMVLPLMGGEYAEKVTENLVKYWQSVGTYTDAEAAAVEKFHEVFKDRSFPPGASILYTQSPNGSLTITFSKDGSAPEASNAVIENRQLAEGILGTILGKHSISPQVKKSLAGRIHQLLKD